jgi:hypothetical protein
MGEPHWSLVLGACLLFAGYEGICFYQSGSRHHAIKGLFWLVFTALLGVFFWLRG